MEYYDRRLVETKKHANQSCCGCDMSVELMLTRATVKIRAMIATGEIAPGSRLSERALADSLELGRAAIREALRVLEQEKLVQIVARRGTFVVQPSENDLVQIYEIRSAIESAAASLAARRGPSIALERQARHLEEMLNEGKGGSIAAQRLGWAFHDEIFAITENALLADLYQKLRMQSGVALKEIVRHFEEQVTRGTQEHLAIFGAIKSRDVEGARIKMFDHVKDATKTRIKLLSDQLVDKRKSL
jgi:DNA-binding GntR family transcriptional regulator